MGGLAGIAMGGVSDVARMWGTRVDGLSEVGRKMRHLAQSTLAIALVLYEEAYGLRPVSFVSVGLLGGLTCLLFKLEETDTFSSTAVKTQVAVEGHLRAVAAA